MKQGKAFLVAVLVSGAAVLVAGLILWNRIEAVYGSASWP